MAILSIDLNEAQIIEMSLRGSDDDIKDRRNFLRCIGKIIIEKRPAQLSLCEADLWFLRDRIDPNIMVGDKSGLSIISEVYKLLVGFPFPDTGLIQAGEGGTLVEVRNATENRNHTQDTTENRTSCRPQAEIESR